MRSTRGTRLAVPYWVGERVPDWLAEVVRQKRAPVPWGAMAGAVLALWAPMAVGFATGRRELALLPAMGGLLSVMIDAGGPYWFRVRRIGTAAVAGGAPGLLIGSLLHGRGWVAVGSLVVLAGVSAVLARLGEIGSVTGLQLFVYSALGLGPLGELRPWWHTALQWGAGVAWALLIITPGYLLAPRSAERKAIAGVYHAIAADLRAIGTPSSASARYALTAALNLAYDAMLTGRAAASGRSGRDTHLTAVLNVSHQFAEAAAALRTTGEAVPPWVTDTVDRLGDAVLGERGPGSGMLGAGGRRSGPGGPDPALPMIPPQWSPSPGALELRAAMVTLARVISQSPGPAAGGAGRGGGSGLAGRALGWLARLGEQLLGGRIAWEFTFRLMLCTGVAAVASQVLPLQRSYWVVLTVGIILKPDFGSVFARAVQRGIGTVTGAVLGAAILAVVPYGPLLLLPFGVLAALLPYAKARNFGLAATFLTPLVVLLINVLDVTGWRLAEARLLDTLLAVAVVLLVGYAPWPSAWQAHLPGQFAGTVRAVCAYMDEALVTAWTGRRGPAAGLSGPAAAGRPGSPWTAPAWRSRLRRRAYRSLSSLRAEFQRTMSEPAPVSRRASAWWPAVVGLDEVMDAVTACAVLIGQGAAKPAPDAVRRLSARLRAVADEIEAGAPPAPAAPAPAPAPAASAAAASAAGALPADPDLAAVTAAVRSVLAVLTVSGEDRARVTDR